MKNWVRVLALSLALMMVLGVSAAFADAYTIPKTLKNVEGLPENPEVPELKTINDGKTETVTVVSGQLVSLSANWNNELVPLTLTDGAVSFDITGKIVQLGMEGQTRTVTRKESIYTVKQLDPSEYWWSYTVLGKNDDGSFKVKEEQIKTEDVYYYSASKNQPIEIPGEVIQEKGSRVNWKGTTVYYDNTKNPYVEATEPGYDYSVPYGWEHVPESYSVPKALYEEVTADDDYDWYYINEDGEKTYIKYTDLTDETGRIVVFDENGNYYVNTTPAHDQVGMYWYYVETPEDKDFEKAILEKQEAGMIAAGLNPDDWAPGYYWYDEDGSLQGMWFVIERQFWAEDIDGYGKAFEGKTADGWTVGYNRKGAACEKSIEMTGVDFFQSETAPSKVTVSWQSGKNMYNKTVWYISKISQEYANEIVTASFAQGGQWNGIKKEAK